LDLFSAVAPEGATTADCEVVGTLILQCGVPASKLRMDDEGAVTVCPHSGFTSIPLSRVGTE
jgi:hypothetical protein